jgi:thioredoxin:protein disulfide reductase
MRAVRQLLLTLVPLFAAATADAQIGGQSGIPEARDLIQVTAAPLTVASGAQGEARVTIRVRESWHINANPPSLDYMIPTEVSLTPKGGITVGKPVYPAPREQKLAFEEKPLRVYDHEFEVRLPIIAVAGTPQGKLTLAGALGFQACNDQVCLAPSSVPFELVVSVEGVAAGGITSGEAKAAGADTGGAPVASPPAGTGFTTAPPAAGTAGPLVNNPIARLFAGGSLAAFLGLFAIGLALNLTPCVYPMLGVTVSIFGARRAAPPLQVFGLAFIYVLGMAVMYSTLGVVAALTGGLFGALLQSPVVLVGIGLLLAALAFSMFGLYELQPPPWMLEKVGGAGTTSAVGIFFSGLVVGVIAAPCVGPPVVALLALVGAKGDPWFGFTSFFTLAMGLGAPYLVLGTFSNLLQRMPRSGDWMVWVKKVFGVIMLSVGLFYVSLAIAPRVSDWILPVALIAGGLYLGFIDRSAGAKPGFRLLRWAVGVLGIAGGIAVIATTPGEGVVFEAFDEQALAATLEGGRPAMLDFTADWCAPCHELERFTFSDRRVKEATRDFRAFKVDLTKYQSPDAERWRRQYGINGVPTVVFLSPDGNEVGPARVEGFIPPARFLERVQAALAATRQASR